MELVRGHHGVGEANLHLRLGFTAKCRRCVFRERLVKRACEESFRETAGQLGLVVHTLAFGQDHVHVFVGACRKHSVAEMVRRLKGASSKRIRRTCWERVKSRLWGTAFWSGGGSASTGQWAPPRARPSNLHREEPEEALVRPGLRRI